MAEYYGNSPSRDYFSLVSALQVGFSPEKVGAVGDKNLFSLTSGFQQTERFPSQPQYQYRLSNSDAPDHVARNASNGDLIFQEVDCLACCDYPCPPSFSGFNPGTLNLSLSHTGEWKEHDVVVENSFPESFSFRPISSLDSFNTSPDWTDRDTNEGSWMWSSWGDWTSDYGPDDGGDWSPPASWSWWNSDEWGDDEQSLIVSAGDVPEGWPCWECGGFSQAPANSPTEAINRTRTFASSILVTVYWKLMCRITKTLTCPDSNGNPRPPTVAEAQVWQGAWDYWFCASATQLNNPNSDNPSDVVNNGNWHSGHGGWPEPPGGNQGFPVVCMWELNDPGDENICVERGIPATLNEFFNAEPLRSTESVPTFDHTHGEGYCGDFCATNGESGEEGTLGPWGNEGIMSYGAPQITNIMKCCAGLGECGGSCSDPCSPYYDCWCNCAECGENTFENCECDPEDQNQEACFNGCYLTSHPDWNDDCARTAPLSQDEIDNCEIPPGKHCTITTVPIPQLTEEAEETSVKICKPAATGKLYIGNWNQIFDPHCITGNINVGGLLSMESRGRTVASLVRGPGRDDDPSTIGFKACGNVPEDTPCENVCQAGYNNINVEFANINNAGEALGGPDDFLGWPWPSTSFEPMNIAANVSQCLGSGETAQSGEFLKCCDSCESACGDFNSCVGICVGGTCSPAYLQPNPCEMDTGNVETNISYFVELTDIDIEVRCGLNSEGNCIGG